jgi:nicotinate-nucleotide adenylyltransferase
MKIGLYFGSFNPIHHGHLIVATYIQQNSDLDKVWFVISPQNPLKPASGLLNEYDRLFLVQVSIEGESKLRASDIEFKLPKPSYTADTLAYLNEKYPADDFAIIMGSDSFQNLPKWKNYNYILQNYPFYIYKRAGYETIPVYPGAIVNVLDAPLLPISATHIRETIREGKSIRYLVTEAAREEIEKNRYFLM